MTWALQTRVNLQQQITNSPVNRQTLQHWHTGAGCEINRQKAWACMEETYVYRHFSRENIWWKLRKKVASQNTEIFVYIIYNSHNRSSANDTDYTKLK